MKHWLLIIIMIICVALSVGLLTAVAVQATAGATVPTSGLAETPAISPASQPARTLSLSTDIVMQTATDQPKYLLAGSDEAAWIVSINSAKSSYGLLFKSVGGKWQWRATDMGGVPAIAESLGESLHMIFPQGDYIIYTPYSDGCQTFPGLKINGKPLSACTAGKSSLVMIVACNPQALPAASASQPATTTTTKSTTASSISAGNKLNAYKTTGASLTLLAPMDELNIGPAEHVMPAMVDDTLFVLISRPGNNRLMAWRNESWRQVGLSESLSRVQMLTALASPEGRLILVYAERSSVSSGSQPSGQLGNMYTMNLASSCDLGTTFTIQPITQLGRPFTWDQASLPRISDMGKNILLLWTEKQTPQQAMVDLEGRMTSVEAIEIMTRPPGTHEADTIIGYFLWAVVIGIFFTLFMVRPAGPPKPFNLPESVKTANLLKRLLAAIIDFLPFCMIAAAIFQPPQLTIDEIMAMGKDSPMELYWYANITALGLYVVYCIAMEYFFAATAGKMLLGLRVVGDEACRPGPREVILRNLLKIVEFMPVWPGLPIPFLLLVPLLTSKRQRLGDILARTTVVKASSLPADWPTVPPPDGDSGTQQPGNE